jgi:hypothetical protein
VGAIIASGVMLEAEKAEAVINELVFRQFILLLNNKLTAEKIVKKHRWLVICILGIFLGSPSSVAISKVVKNAGQNPSIIIKIRPVFIKLPDWGVSVSVGSPYDIILYGKLYYICLNNTWYRSLDCDWPWFVITYHHLPSMVKRLSIVDIKRIREAEYTKRDLRREEIRRLVGNNKNN